MHTRSKPPQTIRQKTNKEITFGQDMMAILSEVVKKHGLVGIKIYWHEDEEMELETFTVEAGIRQKSGSNITDAVLRIADKMPTKTCTNCQREREITHFASRRLATSGIRSVCNICNRQAANGLPTISHEE